MITQTSNKQHKFLHEKLISIIPEKKIITAPEWAENKRVLTSEYSSIPGKYRFKNSPFLREILDCFSINSPVREFAVMKGSQLGFTVGVIENAIGYIIDVAPAPMMYLTADKDLAKANIETRIDSMLSTSDIQAKIGSNTQKKHSHKTGDTATKKEFPGGFLLAVGARNPNKMRQFSVKILLCDEVDAAPDTNQGNPIELAKKRTDTFEATRKICYISTPLLEHNSKIYASYLKGDQRKYFVPCPHCNHMQVLRMGDGKTCGLKFERNEHGELNEDSVCYICESCNEEIYEHHKRDMVNRGEWRATAKAKTKGYRSYHLPAFYSLFWSWKAAILDFLASMNDRKLLQIYYNNVLGEPWTDQSEKVDESVFSSLVRNYRPGIVPNSIAENDGNGKILMLTCAVDVNGAHDKPQGYLDCEVVGHCERSQTYSIAKLQIRGNTDSGGDAWQALHSVIEKTFYSDCQRKIPYKIQYTLIDSGNKQAAVFAFCKQYQNRVSAVRGASKEQMSAKRGFQLFQLSKSQHVFNLYTIEVDEYKHQIADSLRKVWEHLNDEPQPMGYMNFPDSIDTCGYYKEDFPPNTSAFIEFDNGYDKRYFSHYTAEYCYTEEDPTTGKMKKMGWRKRNTRAQNHYFDCRVYNLAAKDIFTTEICDSIKIAPDWLTVAGFFKEKFDRM